MCEDGANPQNNVFNGPLMVSAIKESTKELKEYSTRTLKGLTKASIGVPLTALRDNLIGLDHSKQYSMVLQYLHLLALPKPFHV